VNLEHVLSLLQGVKPSAGGYVARCPSHDDQHASLSIGEGHNGGIVIKCHAGCVTADVLAAMDLTLRDLAPVTAAGSTPVTVYRYDNERGEPVFEVVRTPDKRFWQRLPGAEKAGLGDTPRCLYRIPDLLKADPSKPVFVVEGEKDADRLWAVGMPATTSPMGAGKWRPEYTEWLSSRLRDRSFVILPDNDEPGIKHANEVLSSLRGAGLKAQSKMLPHLPPHGDVSDWLANGGSPEQLAEVASAQERGPEPVLFKKFMTFKEALVQPEPEYLVDGMLFEKSLFEIYGPPNHGKTFVMMSLGFSIRQGGYWCKREIRKPGAIVYVNADGGLGFYDRMRAWDYMHPDEKPEYEFYTYPESISLHRPSDMVEFRAALSYLPQKPAVVIFDTYSRCIPGVNENQQEQASMVVLQLDRIREEIGASVGLLHHSDKTGVRDRGSSVILGACDTQMRVDKQHENIVVVRCEKQRDTAFFDPIHFTLDRIEGTNSVWLTHSEAPVSEKEERDLTERDALKTKIISLLTHQPGGATREDLALQTNTDPKSSTLYLALRDLKEDLRIAERDDPTAFGKEGRKPKRYWLLGETSGS